MMAGEDGVGEIIEPHLTSQAPVALPVPLPLVVAMTCYLVAPALRTTDSFGPAQMPDRLEAFGIIDQGLDVDQAVHRGRLLPAGDDGCPRRKAVQKLHPVISTGRGHHRRASRTPTTPKRVMSLRTMPL